MTTYVTYVFALEEPGDAAQVEELHWAVDGLAEDLGLTVRAETVTLDLPSVAGLEIVNAGDTDSAPGGA